MWNEEVFVWNILKVPRTFEISSNISSDQNTYDFEKSSKSSGSKQIWSTVLQQQTGLCKYVFDSEDKDHKSNLVSNRDSFDSFPTSPWP